MKLNTVLQYATDLDGWARADEMRGASDPDDRDYIHEQYLLARRRLRRAIRQLDNQKEKQNASETR